MSIQNKKLLFFDLAISGHHAEYLYHLIKYRVAHPECQEFVLVTHPDLIGHLRGLVLPQDWHSKGVTILHLSENEMQELSKISSVFKRANAEFRILNRIVHEHQVHRCYLMPLNKFQFAVGSQMDRTLPCCIRGILFNPFGVSGEREPAILTKLRKHFQLIWMLRNKLLEHIYILNNNNLVNALNKKYRRQNLFVSLPDPILIPPKRPQNNLAADILGRSDKYRYLLFGSLSAGKGIFLVLEALKQIPDDIVCHIEVLFAGTIVSNDRKFFLAALSDLRRDRPAISVHLLDEFVPYNSLETLFSNTDCVLLPYIGNQASSGVIGHAALYGKPVISPDSGLIGNIVRSYKLGTVIPTMDSSKLATAMEVFYRSGKTCCATTGMQRFTAERSPTRFVETLIK
jgi:glycosyltransferase involved in cell wall biosynthesis